MELKIDTQQKILEIIKSNKSITYKELLEKSGLKSIGNLQSHIRQLYKQGYLLSPQKEDMWLVK